MSQIFCKKYKNLEVVFTPFFLNCIAVTHRNDVTTAYYVFGEGQFEPPFFELNFETSHFQLEQNRYNFSEGEKLEFIPDWYREWFNKSIEEQTQSIQVNNEDKPILINISETQKEYWEKIGFTS